MSSQYASTIDHASNAIAPPSRTTREGGAALPPSMRRSRWTFDGFSRHAKASVLAAGLLGAACSSDAVAGPPIMTSSAQTGGMGAAGSSGGSVAAGSGVAGALAQAGTAGASTGKLSFANDVFPRVIRSKCSACHSDAPSFGGLAFFPGAETAYANLVGVPAGSEPNYKCKDSGLLRVQPGDPEKSLIYLKLTNPPCGSKMPPGMFGMATQEQVDLVRQWIVEGAAP